MRRVAVLSLMLVLTALRAPVAAQRSDDAVNDVQPSGVEGTSRPVHQLTQVTIGSAPFNAIATS